MNDTKINLSKLRIAREESQLTLKEVADETGFKAATTISRFETGARSVKAEYLMKLSKLYKKPIEYFFD
ncbi:helix-turn-helix domain-containing protein [Exiguobacterium profundum]|uniref:Helix-turn-helix domain-containing protein n=1 Tax=Exiguobacterium profundum TaxID=307643 RepID=A0ABY8B4T0_9BACL|nr:helix-turn-helix transcriptional regulator [Exiguobacterium profundum]WED56153.1 helix-turn-helix domain-containing protein [Exiguobacterium profundum]